MSGAENGHGWNDLLANAAEMGSSDGLHAVAESRFAGWARAQARTLGLQRYPEPADDTDQGLLSALENAREALARAARDEGGRPWRTWLRITGLFAVMACALTAAGWPWTITTGSAYVLLTVLTATSLPPSWRALRSAQARRQVERLEGRQRLRLARRQAREQWTASQLDVLTAEYERAYDQASAARNGRFARAATEE
jgi:hypothetical protein